MHTNSIYNIDSILKNYLQYIPVSHEITIKSLLLLILVGIHQMAYRESHNFEEYVKLQCKELKLSINLADWSNRMHRCFDFGFLYSVLIIIFLT